MKSDLEINQALALAIGWEPEQIRDGVGANGRPLIQASPVHFARPFDYRDWDVIAPIAERYDCFPIKATDPEQGEWLTAIGYVIYTDTPQKAIALAVIGAQK